MQHTQHSFKKFYVRGFTLIELLVVIAIIGILAAVVLGSLTIARDKGTDSAIKASFNSFRSQAGLQYDVLGGSYNTTGTAIASAACSTLTIPGTIFADVTIQDVLKSAVLSSGVESDCGVTDVGDGYSVATALKTTGAGSFWCIESSGIARNTTATGIPYDALTGSATAAHLNSGDTVCQ